MQKHSTHLWLYIGLSSMAITLGYMVGASNSPVVGTAITALFGLGVAAVGIVKDKRSAATEEQANTVPVQRSSNWMRSTGIMLTIFALTFLVATVGGTFVRTVATRPSVTPLPWNGSAPPASARGALEWLVIQRRLLAYGYTIDQVQNFYKLAKDLKEQPEGFLSPQSLLDSVPEPGATLKQTLGIGPPPTPLPYLFVRGPEKEQLYIQC
jgi:hypothetical protein